jgi:hypothetical protein
MQLYFRAQTPWISRFARGNLREFSQPDAAPRPTGLDVDASPPKMIALSRIDTP